MRAPTKRVLSSIVRPAAIATIATAALIAAPLSGSAAQHPAGMAAPSGGISILAEADGTPEGAVAWFKNRDGDTSYQGLCEKAVENAYGTTGVWASALAHWNGAEQHPGDTNPPLGAFVYWNISQYGHVGISDGNGGFYATSVNGAIGHVSKDEGGYGYFNNYLGWTPAAVPSQ